MIPILVFALFLCLVPIQALAAIYKYVDEKGVVHFTNIRPATAAKKYRILIHDVGRVYTLSPRSFRGAFFNSKRFDGTIRYHADVVGLDPLLVKAVMKAESNFNPFAVSSKGAQGLMQLMPGTARHMKVDNPFDPEDNIKGGTSYLKLLHDTFKGDVELVLAAYNAGPARVIEYNMKVPPYEETQNFVKKVLFYYNRLKTNND